MDKKTLILNWREINDLITISGQPTEKQTQDLAEDGVKYIINLAPHSNKGALDNEPKTVADLGMEYIHIPVDFKNPTIEDFNAFCDALTRIQGQKKHIHCIYNARVTAFFYRYACEGFGGSKEDRFALMDGIWRPGGVWAKFIGKTSDIDLPHRYAGEDY